MKMEESNDQQNESPLEEELIESLKALKEALRRHNEESKPDPDEIDTWNDDGGQQ